MATHPLQSTGTIRMSDINLELGRASNANISLDGAEGGLYGTINLLSPSKPSPSNPATLSEWYGYNHLTPDTVAPTTPTGFLYYAQPGGSYRDFDGDGMADYGFGWTASTDNVGVSLYEVYFTRNGVYAGLYTTTYPEIQINPALLDATYGSGTFCFKVRAKDAAGNYSGYTTELCSLYDYTAPTAPTGVATSSVTATTLTLSWSASSDTIGVTNYLIYKDGVLLTTVGNVLTTPITGLTGSTAYAFTVKARDAAFNLSAVSNTANVTTPSANQAPTTPTTFTVTRGTLQATIAWSGATDDVAVTNYEIHRSLDGTTYTFLTYDSVSPYVNTGLASGSTYWYKVRSIDGGGLMSAFTTPKSVTII